MILRSQTDELARHDHSGLKLPCPSADPFQVSILRAGIQESCHEVDLALCDADGNVLIGLGDVDDRSSPLGDEAASGHRACRGVGRA